MSSGFWWNLDGEGAKKRKLAMSWDTSPQGHADNLPTSHNAMAHTFGHLYCLAQATPSSTFSDITFEVGAAVSATARNFRAHRCIVAAWSRPLRVRINNAANAAAAAVSSSYVCDVGPVMGQRKGGKTAKRETVEGEDAAVRTALQRAGVHASGFAGGESAVQGRRERVLYRSAVGGLPSRSDYFPVSLRGVCQPRAQG